MAKKSDGSDPRSNKIPVTALRRLYDLLRAFPSKLFHLSAAAECERRPKELARLLVESRNHLITYDNHQEAFHPRDPGLTPARLQSTRLADVYLQRLARNANEFHRIEPYSFTFVDYEVGPLRTTRSICEDCRSGDLGGAGGIDVLLSDANNQTPVVGAIKADTDVSCFFALIQSLMCAVELSTSAQQKRLSLKYPGRFAFSEGEPPVDVALILLRYGRRTTGTKSS